MTRVVSLRGDHRRQQGGRATPRVLLALAAGLGMGRAAPADPGSLVSFSWSASGLTAADASAVCVYPWCTGFRTCGPSPQAGYITGGSTMEFVNTLLRAGFACGAGCDCCLEGGSGSALANDAIVINDPVTSPQETRWAFRSDINVGAAAGGTAPGPGVCAPGEGSADAQADHAFEMVFDTTAPVTRLNLSRNHVVNVLDSGSALSTWTITGPAGPVFEQRLEQFGPGQRDGSGISEVYLGPGRYTLRVESAAASSASAPGGSTGGGAQVWVSCTVQLLPYECPAILEHPEDVAAAPGLTAEFSVVDAGDEITRRWRRDGVALNDGPTGTGSEVSGSAGPVLRISNVSGADEGEYDVVVTNRCGSLTSNPATLTVVECYADCDPSTGVGVLDIFDFLCFQNRFAGGDPYACDCDTSSGPGVCDIFDFLCYQNAFAGGCP